MNIRNFLTAILAATALLTPVVCARIVPPKVTMPARRMKMVVGGDLMIHAIQIERAQRNGGYDFSPSFSTIAHRFHAADLVVVNFETTLSESGPYSGYPSFRTPTALAEAMHEAGIDVAVTANNHSFDGGRKGVVTTLRTFDSLGIRHTGLFADSTDYANNNPLYIERNGIRMALLDYTYGTNGIPTPKGIRINRIDTAQMKADLATARQAGVDCIAVCIHWGDEYKTSPNDTQRRLAAMLRRNGADLVLGSHPHVVQPIEVDSAGVVVYSMGNMVSNIRRRYCDGGLLVEISILKHPDGRMQYFVEPVPVWVTLPDFNIVPPEVADTMQMPPKYHQFMEDTELILGN